MTPEEAKALLELIQENISEDYLNNNLTDLEAIAIAKVTEFYNPTNSTHLNTH